MRDPRGGDPFRDERDNRRRVRSPSPEYGRYGRRESPPRDFKRPRRDERFGWVPPRREVAWHNTHHTHAHDRPEMLGCMAGACRPSGLAARSPMHPHCMENRCTPLNVCCRVLPTSSNAHCRGMPNVPMHAATRCMHACMRTCMCQVWDQGRVHAGNSRTRHPHACMHACNSAFGPVMPHSAMRHAALRLAHVPGTRSAHAPFEALLKARSSAAATWHVDLQ